MEAPKYWYIENKYPEVRQYLVNTYGIKKFLTWNYDLIGYDGAIDNNGVHGVSGNPIHFYNNAVKITLEQFNNYFLNKNMEKSVKVTPPEGYEIDKENSTFEEIKFRKIEKKLPTKWEDFENSRGYYISNYSEVQESNCSSARSIDRNLWPTKKLAEASLALCQLIRYRDAWNGGWIPDWLNWNQNKYCIVTRDNELDIGMYQHISRIMYFKTPELRNKFLETFKDLLEVAKPLL
jgi:hypothetical protein